MRQLSDHYVTACRLYPNDELCVVFDIDGTILDLRHLVVHVLLSYDATNGFGLFHGLTVDDIVHHENQIDRIMQSLGVPVGARPDVKSFYQEHLWDCDGVLAASRPFEGVFGVIRWFQQQARTHIALNTGRPPSMRALTLDSLNTIGAAYRVPFEPDLLFTAEVGVDVPQAKIDAIEQLRNRGFRVVAVIDNEPENLLAMAAADRDESLLLLHADTIFESQRAHHERVVTGNAYRLRELVPERSFPERVEFVWHGVNDEVNLRRFLESDVTWAELDVRRDPLGRLVLRHDGFDETPWRRGEPTLLAGDTVAALSKAGRSVKLDLKEGAATMVDAMQLVEAAVLPDERVWWNAELPALSLDGFAALHERFPDATISAPVDFLVPLLLTSDDVSDTVLASLSAWGISRLSFRWTPTIRRVLDTVEARGWTVNMYGITDLEAFLNASLMLPTSVTADFNFPEWRFFGRGSGADGALHHWEIQEG